MTDVFDEINDDLRREKLKAFWAENGRWIIGTAIAAVLLTAALSFWQQWKHSRNMKATDALVSVLSADDPAKAESYAASAGKTHAAVARFIAAGTYLGRLGRATRSEASVALLCSPLRS